MTGARAKAWVLWSIVVLCIVTLSLPTLIIIGASFTSGDIIRFPPDGFSLRWYEELASERAFWDALWRSFYVSVICTVLSIPVGTLAAIATVRYRLRLLESVCARGMPACATQSAWFGVTYQEDKPIVVNSLRQLADQGLYPAPLWSS